MIEAAALVFMIAGFLLIIRLAGLAAKAWEVISIARESMAVVQSSDLDDDEKELITRRHSLRLFVLMGHLGLGGTAALLVPAVPIWVMDRLGVLSFETVLRLAVAPEFLVATTVIFAGVIWLKKIRN